MKITVYGGGYKKLSDREINQCQKLGNYLASIDAEIQTGGGTGYPYQVGKAAVLSGARVWGRSPAVNEKEHIEKFNFFLDGVTDMVYMDKTYEMPAEGLVRRMNDMQPFSDVVIALGGNWGTMYELMLSLYYKKTIILVGEFEGAVEAFSWVHDFMGKRDFNPKVHLGATIIKVKDIDAAIKEIEKCRKK